MTDGKTAGPEASAKAEGRSEPPSSPVAGGGEELIARLLRTTEAMASLCTAPQDLWNEHSNACLEAARLLSSPRVEEVRREALEEAAKEAEALAHYFPAAATVAFRIRERIRALSPPQGG